MQFDAREQQQIREYLLGRFPSDQQSQVEERLLVDDDFYQELLIVEDELVDEYLRDELTQTDRTSFELHFLASPDHQEKTRFATSLKRYVAAHADAGEPVTTNRRIARDRTFRLFGFLPMQNPMLGYALAVAAVLIVVGVGWWAAKNWSRNSRQPGRVLAVALTPGGPTRGDNEAVNPVKIGSDVATVRLQLLLANNLYQSYEALLIDSDAQIVTTKSGLTPQAVNNEQAVVLEIEAGLLPAGDYRVKLSGVLPNGASEPLATYSFHVRNR